MTNLGHLIAEVARQVLHLLFLNLQQGSHLGIIVGISLLGIEGDDITGLASVEELLLVISLDIGRHDHATLSSDTTLKGIALVIELTKVTGQRIIAFEHLALDELTRLRLVHLNLLVNQLVIHIDGIVINLILSRQSHAEFRGNGNIKDEG